MTEQNETTDHAAPDGFCERVCDAILRILTREGNMSVRVLQHRINSSVLWREHIVAEDEDIRAALVILCADGSVEEIPADDDCPVPIYRVPAVVRAISDNIAPPVASPLPTDRERRTGASRALQRLLSVDRASVRSTAKGTAAPFSGVVLSSINAEVVAHQLAIFREILEMGARDNEIGALLMRARTRAIRRNRS